MTEAMPGSAKHASITGDDLRAVKFGRAFGRGYEQGEVDSFLERCVGWIEWLNEQLKASEQRNAELQAQVASSTGGAEVQQAISIFTGAQQAADTTVRQADNYSATVMAEAKEFYEETRRRTAALEEQAETTTKRLWAEVTARAETLERDTQVKSDAVWKTASARAAARERDSERNAKAVNDAAQRRAAKLEQETQARVQELTVQAAAEQKELDAQTAYLSTLRETTQIQMQKFLEGMLDHVLDEYGRAHPLAAEAAADSIRPGGEMPATGSMRLGPDRRRTCRPYRVAGQSPRPIGQQVPPPRNEGQFEVLNMVETNGSQPS